MPTSQVEATRLGVKKYQTGKPCKYGHVSERWTLTGNCCACTIQRVKDRQERFKSALALAEKVA